VSPERSDSVAVIQAFIHTIPRSVTYNLEVVNLTYLSLLVNNGYVIIQLHIIEERIQEDISHAHQVMAVPSHSEWVIINFIKLLSSWRITPNDVRGIVSNHKYS